MIWLKRENFETEVKGSKIPVFVDFTADWCGPCRMLAPVLEALAKEYEGKMKFCKVDVDEEGELASQFGIMSIPTLIIFKDGKLVAQKVGALPKDVLKKWIDENLAK